MFEAAKLSNRFGSQGKHIKKYVLFFWMVLTIQSLQSQYLPKPNQNLLSVAQQDPLGRLTGYRFLPHQVTPHWGFFCTYEWKLQQATRIPFYFRLGSLEEVRRLERAGVR